MSVAFRRESDEEHLEPKFEIPITPGPNLVTARGMTLIGQRVSDLESTIASLTDEGALTAAKRDLRYWQTRQVTAELMPVPAGGTVEFGTSVTFLLNGKSRTLGLVGDDEADPAGGLISFSAPLARTLMGAEVGEVLPFGGKDDAIEVQAISLLEPSPIR
jgi:transcription elongation GreA/GreB family factor